MADINEIEAREAKHGEKMIEIKVRFWTNNLTPQKDNIIPKNGWASGVVRIAKNDTHGVKSKHPIPFNSLMEIPAAIEQVLVQHGIKLHIDRAMKIYLV